MVAKTLFKRAGWRTPRSSARLARGDNRADSDIDILVEFDPEAHGTVVDYVGVKDYIASLGQPVDVIDREALKPHLRRPSARDALYAF